MQICFLTGHRDAPEELYPQILKAARSCIERDMSTEFVVGCRGRFDALSARAIRELKRNHPRIRLTLLLPYLTNKRTGDGFDEILFPSGIERVPKRLAIVHANRYAASICDVLIIYAQRSASNTRKLLEYTQAHRKSNPPQIIHIHHSRL